MTTRSLLLAGLPFLVAAPSSAQLGPAFAGRVAQARNAAVVNSNPAGIVRVDGTQVVLDATVSYSFAEFEVKQGTTTSGGDPDTDDTPVVIPTFSLSHRLSERFWVGLGAFFPAGIGSDYGSHWAGRYYTTESSLIFLSVQPVLAFRATDWLSLGVGPAITYVSSESQSAVNNLQPGLPDGKLKLDLDDTTVGVVASLLLEPLQGTRLGVSYRSEQEAELKGKPRLSNLGPLLEAALDAAGVLGAPIDLEVKFPQIVQAGFHQELSDRLSIMGDVTWFDWSRFGRVNVTVSDTSFTAKQDYNDIWVGSFGAEYALRDDLSASAGFSYISSAVDSEDRTLALPFDEIYLFGVGTRYRVNPKLAVHANFQASIFGDGRVDQQGNPLAGRIRGESTDNYSIGLQLSLVWGSKPLL